MKEKIHSQQLHCWCLVQALLTLQFEGRLDGSVEAQQLGLLYMGEPRDQERDGSPLYRFYLREPVRYFRSYSWPSFAIEMLLKRRTGGHQKDKQISESTCNSGPGSRVLSTGKM